MRLISLALLAILSLAAQNHSQDEAAIRTVVTKYVEARRQTDAKATAELFTADTDQLVSTGEWRKGKDAVVKGTMASSQTSTGKRTISVETIRFLANDIAIMDGRYMIAGISGGPDRNMWTTMLLKRTPQGWRIAAIRNMLPDTEQARAR